ncbi:MAG: hypothetical protein HKN10_15090, partial [Myxococcales bacterium]|nr:hypothetical protein [Myxococcales bacterium]
YLLDNMVWMISDSTGIMPSVASAAGFEQTSYGWFEKPFLPGAGSQGSREFRKLYKSQKRRKLGYRYGYPDGSEAKHSHMIVTRKKK